MQAFIQVVYGNRRERVGQISAVVGMMTNIGRLRKVTEAGSVIGTGPKPYRICDGTIEQVTITLTEARRYGYPAETINTELPIIGRPRRRQLVAV